MDCLTSHLSWRQLLVGVITAAALVLTGCGDEDQCAGVSCDFGTCDSATGQCINPSQCRSDGDCVPGYECGADYACEPVEDCTADDECDAGVCQDGACVNPSSCASNDDCRARTFCGPDGTCEPDPCNGVSCQRGVCERGTDNCVSADSCTPETESFDCVAGDKCAEGSCESAETFCDDISCERGECSFEAGGCANAEDCNGDDTLCMADSFCNDDDQCQPDLCVINEVDCGDNGVCIPAAGLCENATSCTSNSDCTAGHLCVDDTCRLESVACGEAGGDGGCPGNQLCEYDEDNLAAVCVEPAQCETSFDCTGDRQCGGLNCVEPVSCVDDYFEPNDIADEATDFLGLAGENTLPGSACTGDSDFFFFDSTELIDASQRGTLLIEVDVPARDEGLGQLEVELTDPTGATMDSTSGALGANGKVRLEKAIGLTDHGEYTVEVSAADDMSDSGVHYDLSVNLLPNETIKACEDALPLRVNQRVSGDTAESDSQFLGSSCTTDPNPSKEVVYALEIDAPQEVTFHLTPQLSSADMTMSLRSRCTQASTERACADGGGEGDKETMTALLEAGTHYLVVQANDGATGAFELLVERIYTACAPGDSYCEDGQVSQICTSNGGRFNTLDCDAGCNPSSGRCFPPDGDVCLSAPIIDADTSYEIQLGQLNNEYELTEDGCAGEQLPNTDGPEQTYQIELPAQKAVTADVIFGSEAEGTLYWVENCTDASATCLGSASGSDEDNASREVLRHANFTDDDTTLFLVVDTGDDQTLTTADLQVTFHDISCTPGARQCGGSGDVEMCDEYGIAYRLEEECGDLQCGNGGYCLDGDTCNTAYPLSDGDSVSEVFSGITSHITTGNGQVGQCNFTSSTNGDEAEWIYEIDLLQGEVLTVTYDPTTSLSIMYLMDTCGDANSCLVNGGRYSSSGTHELKYLADKDGPVYLAVSRNSGTSSSFGFDLSVDISPADCDPSTYSDTCVDSTTLDQCTDYGEQVTATCSFECVNDACTDPDTCSSALDVTTDANQSGGVTYSNITWGDFSDSVQGSGCGISSSFTDAHDVIFEVSLQSGDILRSKLISNDSSPDSDPALYFASSCGNLSSSTCLDGDSTYGDPIELTYQASSAETVYVVADSDDTSSNETFDIEFEVMQPACNPATDSPSCANSTDYEYCKEPGTWETYTCDNGCASGTCSNPTGNFCPESIDATSDANQSGGVTYTGTWSDFTNEFYNFNCHSTDWYSEGEDVVYRVDLLSGETVSASLTASGSGWPTVAISTGCFDATSTCVDGQNSSSTATASYTATSDETVYVIADNDWINGGGGYTLDIDVQ